MKRIIPIILTLIILSSCNGTRKEEKADKSEPDATGLDIELAPDVLVATKPLISGQLYRGPSFESPTLASFDTSQLIQVLDTTHNIFVKARIRRDSVTKTGYIARTILPEKTKPAK